MKVPMLWVMACLMCVHLQRMNAQQFSYKPQFMYLLDCGAPHNTTLLLDNRQWVSDNSSAFLSSSTAALSISASTSGNDSIDLPSSNSLSPLLSTARIFNSQANYAFPVTAPGRYWIRLYFYLPFSNQENDPSLAIFSVMVASYTLMFRINMLDAIRSRTPGSNYLFKEYSINATDTPLVLTFSPSGSGSYAFVNAIEVVSMPSDLFTDDTSPLQVNSPAPIGIPNMALETVYRLNVGGPLVTPMNDTEGIFRTWLPNETFIFSSTGVESISTDISSIAYASSSSMLQAPPIVYSTALQMEFSPTAYPKGLNLTYALPVDGSYHYVVRLHFCELVYTTGGKRVFNIYLQNQTAYSNLDLGKVRRRPDTPYYRDFSLEVKSEETSLWIQAGPPPDPVDLSFNKAILNGIEVWKMNNSHASLDRVGALQPSNSASGSMLGIILGATVGGMAALVLLMLLAFVLLKHFRGRPAKKDTSAPWVPLTLHKEISSLNTPKSSGRGSMTTSVDVARHFTLAEMLDATRNFDESRVLGVGGFGKVYLGELDDGKKVAVKRGSQGSQQGIIEFQAEIDTLSKLRHRHLVSLIGHCKEQNEMILVYEYMANGTLRGHLYGSDLPSLPWKQRLEICIGATRGIHYLHTGAAQCIIHRDVKSTNILLDDNFVAKMSDFGLSKTGPTLDQTHVTTAVKGSIGYLDPEYFRRQLLTKKSDIYSLGVVLLEVLCARPPIDPTIPGDHVNLAEWALQCKGKGTLEEVVDPNVAASIDGKCLRKFAQVAESCLAEEGVDRPSIGDVLWNLEQALHLQEEGVSRDLASIAEAGERACQDKQPQEEGLPVEEEEEEEEASSVFSRLVFPQGR